MIVAVSAAGLLLFIWPLLGFGPVPVTVAICGALGLVLVLGLVEVATRSLSSRDLVLIAVIAAIDSALRAALVEGIGGFSPIFFLILAAGYTHGSRFGFVAGAVALLASAVVTGGLGPWLPYEMLACGWMGVVAGLVGRGHSRVRLVARWSDVLRLAVAAVPLGFLYGALTDVWDWSQLATDPSLGFAPGMSAATMLAHFVRFYVSTSLVYDSFRGIGTAVCLMAVGRPVLTALMRQRARRPHSPAGAAAAPSPPPPALVAG